MSAPLLELRDLRVVLPTARGPAAALRGVSFTMARGEKLGLIGESGCGKSLSALAIMGLLPEGARIEGSIRLNGAELVGLADDAMARLRGDRVAMIFQEPMTALNPLHTVGAQVAEPLRLHRGLDRSAARAEALRLLDRVRLPDAVRRLDAYPHQLSGGQRQRIMVARALMLNPKLIIADEPVSMIDASLRAGVLASLRQLRDQYGISLVYITHDLTTAYQICDDVIVLYRGSVAEAGEAAAAMSRAAGKGRNDSAERMKLGNMVSLTLS